MKKIKVRITKTANWYKKGEVHDVINRVVFDFHPRVIPCFQKGKGLFGIECDHCKILPIDKDENKKSAFNNLMVFVNNFNALTGI